MTVPPPTLRVLVCGSADRGDDGAALSAIAHVLPGLEPDICRRIEIRRCPQLDATDLIDVRPDEACLVLDTVLGVPAGEIVDLPLESLADAGAVAPRSSHALPIQQVVAIAAAVRGGLPGGRFLGIGGRWFGYGQTRSRALRDGMAAYERAVRSAITELVGLIAVAS